jgi:hypothetical protein
MKLTRLILGLAIFMVSVAGAASSYKIALPSDLYAGDVQLKAGEYTLTLEGKQAVFKKGKQSIQVPFSVEKSALKFPDTELEIDGMKIQSIDLGGTDMKITFRASH